MLNRIVTILGLLFLLRVTANAQFEKANEQYADKQFAAAIPLYEAGLKGRESLFAKTRLAYCYKVLGKSDKAVLLFAEIVQQPNARSDTYKYYAESLMNIGNYIEAKKWFLEYARLEPQDSSALAMVQACDLAPNIPSYFSGLFVEPFNHNSAADDNSAVFYNGGLVFTSDRSLGAAFLKEKSGFTGRDFSKLYYASYQIDKNSFHQIQPFSGKFNDLNVNTSGASFSGDGLQSVFSRNNTVASKKGEYKMQLYCTSRKEEGAWRNANKLKFCNQEKNYMHPSLSITGDTLYYISDTKGLGGYDIFRVIKKNGDWGTPSNLGETINTTGHEAYPFAHADGRLFFCSKGHAGMGGFDIFVSHPNKVLGSWGKPINLGSPINSPLDDISFFLMPNDSVGLFSSQRNVGNDDIFVFWLGTDNGLGKAVGRNKAIEMKEPDVINETKEKPN